MKGILLLNGEPFLGDIDPSGAAVYCCDGAYAWARGRVRIDKNVGDFDSLPYIPSPAPEEIYPAEKNFTDGEIALFKMLSAGIDDITIYGGGGGREDHFVGNLQLLYAACARGARARMITNSSVIFAASGRTELGEWAGRTFSVFPFCGALHIMGSEGVRYAYPPVISAGECRGVSNIVLGCDAYVEFAEGDVALVIVNRGKV